MKKSESSCQRKGESEKDTLETEHRAVLEGTAGTT